MSVKMTAAQAARIGTVGAKPVVDSVHVELTDGSPLAPSTQPLLVIGWRGAAVSWLEIVEPEPQWRVAIDMGLIP